jgi:hypothetical protein
MPLTRSAKPWVLVAGIVSGILYLYITIGGDERPKQLTIVEEWLDNGYSEMSVCTVQSSRGEWIVVSRQRLAIAGKSYTYSPLATFDGDLNVYWCYPGEVRLLERGQVLRFFEEKL